MELYCPNDGEHLASTRRQDGFPVFTCFTCGSEYPVNIYTRYLQPCAECDGDVIGEDYLCGKCRYEETAKTVSTEPSDGIRVLRPKRTSRERKTMG